MPVFRRTPAPEPEPVDIGKFLKGLETFASDLKRGVPAALDMLDPRGDFFLGPEDVANWPKDPCRLEDVEAMGSEGASRAASS